MKRELLLQYIGNQVQSGGTRHYMLTDGPGRNLRCIDVNCGSGLQYTILPDRGLDISLAAFRGNNLVFISPNGETHPSFFEPEGLGWLRTFSGGLLTTCGLTYLGAPVTDGNEQLGLHGRYSTLPARQVADLSEWQGDEYIIRVRGIIEEGYVFGNKMRVEREISSVAGRNTVNIKDIVTNFGYTQSPYTILYHMNLGYPLLSEDAELIIDPVSTTPATDIAAESINDFRKFTRPQAGYHEQVFFHKMAAREQGWASAILKNEKTGISLEIRFDTKTLPYLTQWKMMGKGDYVLGLEPCNVPPKNRKTLKDEGILPVLQPGESVTNNIEVNVTAI